MNDKIQYLGCSCLHDAPPTKNLPASTQGSICQDLQNFHLFHPNGWWLVGAVVAGIVIGRISKSRR